MKFKDVQFGKMYKMADRSEPYLCFLKTIEDEQSDICDVSLKFGCIRLVSCSENIAEVKDIEIHARTETTDEMYEADINQVESEYVD